MIWERLGSLRGGGSGIVAVLIAGFVVSLLFGGCWPFDESKSETAMPILEPVQAGPLAVQDPNDEEDETGDRRSVDATGRPFEAAMDGTTEPMPEGSADPASAVLSDTSGAPIDPGVDPVPSGAAPDTPGLASTGAIEVDTSGDLTEGPDPGLPVCDDGNPATVDLREPNGFSCTYQALVCDDGNVLTSDYYDIQLQACVFQFLLGAPPPANDPPAEDNPTPDRPPAEEPPPEDEPPADEPPADDPPAGPMTLVEDFSDDTDPAQPGLSGDGAIQHDFSDAGWTFVDEAGTPLSEDYPSGPHAIELFTATDTVTFPGQTVEHVAVTYSTEFTGAAQILVIGTSDSKTFDLAHADGWGTVEADATDLGDNGIAVGEILALELAGAEVFYDDIEITLSP
jgi:hypothetical protein